MAGTEYRQVLASIPNDNGWDVGVPFQKIILSPIPPDSSKRRGYLSITCINRHFPTTCNVVVGTSVPIPTYPISLKNKGRLFLSIKRLCLNFHPALLVLASEYAHIVIVYLSTSPLSLACKWKDLYNIVQWCFTLISM